jgi:hypothetical protein
MPKTAPSRSAKKSPVKTAQPVPKTRNPVDFVMPAQDALFFLFYFLFVWLVLEPKLLFHGGWNTPDFPVFYRGAFFFKEHLVRPGGLVDYASKFLSQLLVYSWAGAAVLAFQAWLITACSGILIAGFISPRFRVLRFLPALALLALDASYTFHFIPLSSLALALIFLCLSIRIRFPSTALECAALVALPILLYVLAGASVWIFVLPCALHSWLARGRWLPGLACLAAAASLPYIVGVQGFGLTLPDAFSALAPWSARFLRFHPRGMLLVYGVYFFPVAVALWMAVRRAVGFRPEGKPAKTASSTAPILETAAVLVLAALAAFAGFNRNLKTLLKVDYFAFHRMWPEVLDAAGPRPANDFIMAAVDRSLAHLGRLGDSEIALRQQPGTLLLNDGKYRFSFWFQFDIFLDLGYVNRADHQLTESLDYYGERPQILQRLGLVNMVKGNTGTAGIYLGALGRMPFYGKTSAALLSKMASDSVPGLDPEVRYLRESMLRKDRVHEVSFDALFRELLEINPRNRMAFEYLMTFYLLTLDLDGFVANLDRLKGIGYDRLPRLYEQALLIGSRNPSLHSKIRALDLDISMESKGLYRDFVRTLDAYKQDPAAAAVMEFPGNLTDSYFVYYYLNFKQTKE